MNKRTQADKDRELIITAISVAGVVVAAIIVTFLIKTYVIEKDPDGLSRLDKLLGVEPGKPAPREFSMQQAYSVCKGRVESTVSGKIQMLKFDKRSSRYSEAKNRFTVFLDIEIKTKANKVLESWSYCHIAANTGKITEFRLKGEGTGFNFN